MVQTRSGKISQHEGLRPAQLSKKQRKRLLKEQQSIAASGTQILKAHDSKTKRKQMRKARASRLQAEILGSNRKFPGRILIPTKEIACATDELRLKDIHVAMNLGNAIVYWADGSFSGSGYLGAGVAWRGSEHFLYKTYPLGRHTGWSSDGELFAIAAALGRARKEVNRNEHIERVRVYTDAKSVLEELADGHHHTIGPMINKKTALQGLYERAEWLVSEGVKLELIWVKGHAQSEGNMWADRAATEAVNDQRSLNLKRKNKDMMKNQEGTMTTDDVPGMWKELGLDWADEWLARANARVHLGSKFTDNLSVQHSGRARSRSPPRDRPLRRLS